MPYVKLHFVILAAATAFAADIRVGIIGTDTSHVPAFTKMLNGDAAAADHIAGARVVAAYKGISKDIPDSFNRVDRFADEIQKQYGVEIVPDIATLLTKVDAVMIESVDARPHLAYAKQVIAAKKPLWIDKPLASTLEDAREIARLAKAAGVPWFSASSLRWSPIAAKKYPDATSILTWGPGPFEEHHYLELAWYAIHPIEMLFTMMGPGVESVSRTSGKDVDEIVGKWKDGRIGTVRAMRPYGDYGAVVTRSKASEVIHPPGGGGNYRPLVVEIIKFFQTGKPAVPNEETLEIFAFMDAAQKSKEQGGRPVALR
jgi:hypothetical protein